MSLVLFPIHFSLFSGKIIKPYTSVKVMTVNRFLLYKRQIIDM